MGRSRSTLAVAALLAATVVISTTPAGAGAATGVIAGSVDESTSGAPVADVCVYAYPASGEQGSWATTGAPYRALTEGDGSYAVSVPVANYVVEFDPSCHGTVPSPYALQYYFGQLDMEDANPVFASAISPTTGVDAHLVAGYSVSGTVTEAGGSGATVCASADDGAGHLVNSAKAVADGSYTIGNLPAGTYDVYFDPTCAGTQASTYAPQYYKAGPDLTAATGVTVPVDATGIDAELVPGATISGTVTATGALDDAGICVYALASDGSVAGHAITGASGGYQVANLAAQPYDVRFDPTCDRSQSSYFASLSYAKQVSLSAGQTVPGVDGALALAYGPALSIVRASLDPGVVGSPYCETVSLSGPDMYGSAYQASQTGLPPGLSLSGVEGEGNEGISGGSRCQEVAVWGPSVIGYPQSAGTFKVTVTVTTVDSVPNLVATRTFKMVISASQVSIGSSSAALSGRYLPVRLSCGHTRAGVYEAAPGRPCAGRATLTAETAAVLATAAYSVANGKSATVRLMLTAAGSKALAHAKVHLVKDKLSVTLNGRPGQTEMLLIS
jgi:hypothetical protein